MKYYRVKDGEFVKPIKRGYKMACCDCGLTHKINFFVQGKTVIMQAFRDKRATAQVRRSMKK